MLAKTGWLKILDADMRSCNSGSHQWEIGEWYEVENPVVCSRGFHLVDSNHTHIWLDSFSKRLFEAEWDGECDCSEHGDGGKIAVSRARLVREIPLPEVYQQTKAVMDRLSVDKFGTQTGRVRKSWTIIKGSSFDTAYANARAVYGKNTWSMYDASGLSMTLDGLIEDEGMNSLDNSLGDCVSEYVADFVDNLKVKRGIAVSSDMLYVSFYAYIRSHILLKSSRNSSVAALRKASAFALDIIERGYIPHLHHYGIAVLAVKE